MNGKLLVVLKFGVIFLYKNWMVVVFSRLKMIKIIEKKVIKIILGIKVVNVLDSEVGMLLGMVI